MSLNLGQSSTIETLLEFKFQPTRTVVLSFGFDEEASGLQVSHDHANAISQRRTHNIYLKGAGKLGPYFENIYGENGFAMIVDEGGCKSPTRCGI